MAEGNLKAAVIGCGGISWDHLGAYKADGRAQIVGVVDVAQGPRDNVSGAYKVKAYESVDALLGEVKPDVASICTPPPAHAPAAEKLLSAGVHVLCEKPMTVTARAADAMIALAEKNKLVLMTAFCWRFHNTVAETKKWLDSGVPGKVIMFRNRFGCYIDMAGKWFGEREKGGGVLKECSIHSIDMFRYLVGEVAGVSGCAATLNTNIPAEDSAIYMLESTGGAIGVVEGAWSTPKSGNIIEVYCQKGAAVIDVDAGTAVLKPAQGAETIVKSQEPNRFGREISHFLDCVTGKAKPLIGPLDGRRAVEVAEAILKSIDKRKWIKV